MSERKKDSNVVKLGFFLSRNLGFHILFSIILNFIITVVLIGLFDAIKFPIFNFKFMGLIMFIVIATLLEVTVLIFIVRHLIKLVIKSFGLMLVVVQGVIFYLTTLLVVDLSFQAVVFVKIVVFTIAFLILKIIAIIIIQRYKVKYKE